jgi:Domain of unknown function (DUF222)
VPADAQHPLPGDVFPGAPAHRASLTSTPFTPSPRTPDAFTDAPFPSDPVLDEILDWEMEALPRKEDPYRSYCEEGEPRDEEEWLEESYILAAPGAPCPERFAVGGTADAMAPGPALAILADRVQRDGLDLLDDDQLTGVLQAANRLASWSASLKLAATSRLAARREAGGRKSGDWRPFDHVDDEVAVALTLTRRSAARLLDLALSLDRLPLTRAALAAGLIDERRAEVIAEELSGLDDARAAAVEKLIIGKAPGLTTGQLRALARRLVISADPAAARQRKEQALRDARVETFTEHAGTAGLSGRDLSPAGVLAADKHLTALAQAMKAAGITGTMDTLRASACLHLLCGQPASTLIPGTPAPGAASPDGSTPPGPGSPHGSATPASPGLRGTVNLTMPLSAWLGWTQSPGDVPGFGPLDAADSRTLAGLLAANPANQWCVTLTGPAGHPVAHACASPGTRPHPGASLGPGPRGGPGGGRPDSQPSRDRPPAARLPGTGPPGTGPPATTTDPAATTPPDWLRSLTFTTLETRDCSHPRESRGYQPSPALRHLIEIRNPACTAPGCRRAAARCDLDHVTPYHHGGRTCECNLGPASKS